MSVTYLPSYIEKTYNDSQTLCENGVCTSMQSLCNLENDDWKCLEKYSFPSGLVVSNRIRNPMRKPKTDNHKIIENDNFDIMYNMLLLNNNKSNSTSKNNKPHDSKTRKKNKKQ